MCLVLVRFEKFKNSLVAENQIVLPDGLDPLFARPNAFLSVSDGRMGSIWNTDFWAFWPLPTSSRSSQVS